MEIILDYVSKIPNYDYSWATMCLITQRNQVKRINSGDSMDERW